MNPTSQCLLLAGLLIILPAAGGRGAFAADAIKVGDGIGSVSTALGEPEARSQIGGVEILYYRRGPVVMFEDKVLSFQLLSTQELTARETRRLQFKAEGEKLKADKIKDAAFQATPLSYQVSFWQDFRNKYPDTDVSDLYKTAMNRYDEELAAEVATAGEGNRIAAMETRVNLAEQRAAQTALTEQSKAAHERGSGYSPSGISFPADTNFNAVTAGSKPNRIEPLHPRPQRQGSNQVIGALPELSMPPLPASPTPAPSQPTPTPGPILQDPTQPYGVLPAAHR